MQVEPDRAPADAALELLVRTDAAPSCRMAEGYAVRKDPDGLFKWLDGAWARHDAGIQLLLFDPLLLRCESDPRFAAFCRKVGLPTTTDAVAMR